MVENEDKKELQVIADAMLDKKAKDVVSLDLTSIGTAISDFFVVCNADSTTQVAAICDNVEESMFEKCKDKAFREIAKEYPHLVETEEKKKELMEIIKNTSFATDSSGQLKMFYNGEEIKE